MSRQTLRVVAWGDSRVHFSPVFTGSWGCDALVPDVWEWDEEEASQYPHALEKRLREFVGHTAGRPARFVVVEAANHCYVIAKHARRRHPVQPWLEAAPVNEDSFWLLSGKPWKSPRCF